MYLSVKVYKHASKMFIEQTQYVTRILRHKTCMYINRSYLVIIQVIPCLPWENLLFLVERNLLPSLRSSSLLHCFSGTEIQLHYCV